MTDLTKMNNTAQEILNAIRRQMPVGNVTKMIDENLPDMVMYHVERSARLGRIEDEATEMLEDDDGIDPKTMIRFLMEIADEAD